MTYAVFAASDNTRCQTSLDMNRPVLRNFVITVLRRPTGQAGQCNWHTAAGSTEPKKGRRSFITIRLCERDLIDSALVTTSLKIGLEERTYDIQRHHRRDEISRKAKDIRVIMLARQFG